MSVFKDVKLRCNSLLDAFNLTKITFLLSHSKEIIKDSSDRDGDELRTTRDDSIN